MERWRYIEENAVSAAHGLAVDELLPSSIGRRGSPPILHLYSFVPSVIIGRYQILEDSIDADACTRRGFQFNRRITGGGTVMMGPDQLALGFSVPFSHPKIPKGIRAIFESLGGVLRSALKSLGIEAGFRPKNDVTIDGKKVAGLSASLEDEDCLFFHTSLCIGFDIEMMLELLKLPVEKLSDKGISCFSERMTTVRRALGREIDFDTVRSAVKTAFMEHFEIEFEDSGLDPWEAGQADTIAKRRYESRDWLHAVKGLKKRKGRALKKTVGGIICVDVAFSGNIIETILLTGDFFSTSEAVHRIEAALRWSSAGREDLLRHLREAMDDETIYGVTPELLADLVREAIEERLKSALPISLKKGCASATSNGRGPRRRLFMESPDYVRVSLAAAMTLGFKNGLFHRGACLHCINLLVTCEEGCTANCGYCGLARERIGRYAEKSFIHVEWPILALDDVIERMEPRRNVIRRVCISMITNRQSVEDTLRIARRIRSRSDIPLSLLVSPTVLREEHLLQFKEAGADKIGIAIDAATQEIFEKWRGKGVRGPHRWSRYFEFFEKALGQFGERNVGAHFIVGLGETEEEMLRSIDRIRKMGGVSHLFSFFPERGSAMAQWLPAPMDQYRRIQLARYLIDEEGLDFSRMKFDSGGRLIDFGTSRDHLETVIASGEPFRTSGCKDNLGQTACNRPFGNSPPDPEQLRNYPFPLDKEDIERVKKQLWKD